MDGEVGHNKPPSQIRFTEDTASALGDWLKINPIVETEEVAREGKLLVDRARLCLQDLDDERKGQTAPLNEQLKQINARYASPKAVLDKLLTELKARLNVYVIKEEEIRRKAAEEARKRAEEAEQAAREAEEREQEAADDARQGVESDIGTATKDADEKFAAYKVAQRELARAERDTSVKIGGGFGRVLGSRLKETLVILDPDLAITDMGWTQRLLEVLMMEAREYRRRMGKLPKGIISQQERKI